MLDDEFLRKLHHVLLEVRVPRLFQAQRERFLTSVCWPGPCRRGRDGMSQLLPCLQNYERYSEHGKYPLVRITHAVNLADIPYPFQLLTESEI